MLNPHPNPHLGPEDNPWENFGEQKYVPGVAHVPAKLQKYVGKHFTRENYSDYKNAEHEASIMMREQLAKERKQGLKSVEAHHEVRPSIFHLTLTTPTIFSVLGIQGRALEGDDEHRAS